MSPQPPRYSLDRWSWPVAVLITLYYLTPVAVWWSRGSLLVVTMMLAVAAASLALVAGRRSSRVGWLIAVAVLLRVPFEIPSGALVVLIGHLARRRSLLQVVLAVASATGASVLWPLVITRNASQVVWMQAALQLAGVTVAAAVGYASRSAERARQSEAARALAEEQRRLEAQRADEARLEQVRMAERDRIAREMHDVLAHRLSLVAMASGALAHRSDLPREQLLEAVAMINENARRSLDELRLVLGSLRTPGAVPEAPQPALAQLEALVTEARAAGQQVLVDQDLNPDRVPAGIGRHLYRIVQEALTNARKHAPGQPVHLTLGHDGSLVTVRVSNPLGDRGGPAVPGAGLGLVGLAERVDLLQGQWSAT